MDELYVKSVCVDGQAVLLGATDLRGWGARESWKFSPTLGPWQIRGFVMDAALSWIRDPHDVVVFAG